MCLKMMHSLIPDNFEKMQHLVLTKYIPKMKVSHARNSADMADEFPMKEIIGVKMALEF